MQRNDVRLLGSWPLIKKAEPGKEQAVILSMRLSNDNSGNEIEHQSLMKLEAALARSLADSHAGEWDGHEIGGGYRKIYLYGPCAERLSQTILTTVLAYDALPGSYMVKRFGEIGSDEEYIWLNSDQRA
jgi:hypothetical protein